jgi:hypothetical protein
VAVGFENIATGAHEKGCTEAARHAGEAFASVTMAGTSVRGRDLQSRPRKAEAQME